MRLRSVPLRLRGSPIIWGFHDVPDREWFERCVEDILSAWKVVPLTEIAAKPRRRRVCAITFDDGLRSVFDVAAPILEAHRVPYTVFVCTEVLVGGPVPWFLRLERVIDRAGVDAVRRRWGLLDQRFREKHDVIIAMKQIPLSLILAGLDELEEEHRVQPPNAEALFASVHELRAMAKADATIGSHTHRHATLSVLEPKEQRLEIEESLTGIEALFGVRAREFAYPNGTPIDFDASTIALLRAAGVHCAVTTTQRHVRSMDDPLVLPRIGLSTGDSYVRRVLKTVVPSVSTTNARERALRSRVGTT
jgi:peptidoglycan/xylan/chitin deacetylase (PgdA/CDA1 family)